MFHKAIQSHQVPNKAFQNLISAAFSSFIFYLSLMYIYFSNQIPYIPCSLTSILFHTLVPWPLTPFTCFSSWLTSLCSKNESMGQIHLGKKKNLDLVFKFLAPGLGPPVRVTFRTTKLEPNKWILTSQICCWLSIIYIGYFWTKLSVRTNNLLVWPSFNEYHRFRFILFS